MKSLWVILFSLIPLSLIAQQQTFTILPASSQAVFDVSAQVHHVHGVSQALSGTITGDPNDISNAKLDIKIDAKSFDTDNDSRDRVMREKCLEVDKFPEVEFISTGIQSEQKALVSGQPAKVIINGNLRLHGMEKPTSIPVTINWQNTGTMTADGDLALVLDDWKIFRPKVVFFRLSNDIKIHIHVGATRQTAQP